MHDTIVGLLERADLAIAACAGVVSEGDLESMARSIRDARIRVSYPEDMSVVALVGGTGSGKSSLANALSGTELAMVGGVRPTTEEPLAIVPETRTGDIAGYLAVLGVEHKTAGQIPEWLCLIDMPDTDSVEVEHRLRVERLLPRLDVVVWVVDPEKYRDAALHDRYLKSLSPYSSQFVFVLNQVDRLAPGVVESVVADFRKALDEDGITSPRIVTTAANPPSGPPMGVPGLVDALRDVSNNGQVFEKLLVDLEQGAEGLLAITGGAGLDFETRARATVETSARMVVDGDTRSAIDDLTSFLESIAAEAGGSTGSRVREIAAFIPSHVQASAGEVRAPTSIGSRLRPRTRSRDLETLRSGQRDSVGKVLDDLVIVPTRSVLALRAQANAALTDLVLSVATFRRRDY